MTKNIGNAAVSTRELCNNCDRVAGVDEDVVRENGRVYCGQNCYWSVLLDVNNSRLKKRKGKKKRRREARNNLDVEEDPASEAAAAPAPAARNHSVVPQDVYHAMFAFHARISRDDFSQSCYR